MSKLLDGLNPQQLAAVTLPHQSTLILAGAGSGKTRVLTTRIAWLLQTGQVSPSGILAVTFTNKAAREMLTRLSTMLPATPHSTWIGTFHGLSNRLLRTHHHEAGLPRLFQILDSADQLSAIKRMLKGLQANTEKFDPKKVQQFINQNKDQGLRGEQVETWDPYNRQLVEYYLAYDAQCMREGVVDFAELLLRSHELLSRNQALREHYQQRFRHVLIDEFQDTNRLQYRWLKQFASHDSALMAVGDDDQSIYGFRGAHSGNMNDFQRDYAHDNIIRLEQNYRSQGNILDAANALINQNPGRLGKTLWTAAGQGDALQLYAADSDQEEARFICTQAATLHQQGHSLSDMALLYRSNAQSRVLEHALFSAGMAYQVYGGLRFFERQEVKHALAYLRLLVNPDDDNAFTRIVNFPTRGIGTRTLELLDAQARQQQTSLWRAAVAASADNKGLGRFVALMNALQDPISTLPLPEAIAQVLDGSGLSLHYQNEKDGQDRLDNLIELINAASVFVRDNENNSDAPLSANQSGMLGDFLAHTALEAGTHQSGNSNDALQLMTIHAAKGLEFRTVFLTGLEQGLFPSELSMQEAKGVEEERRLMYVALTRAREHLYLSYAHSRMLHGQTRYGIPSQFLNEIPANLVQTIRPAFVSFAHSRQTDERAFADTWDANPSAPHTPQRAHASSRTGNPGGALKSPAPSNSPWRLGMSARHPKFGLGVIVNLEGQGDDARVQINFGAGHGTKWLALAYARLEAVSHSA
jgi:DNA helicase-2/ATP-dependent DNA helicase PcrA